MSERFLSDISKRKIHNRFRFLRKKEDNLIDFSSNDYLGLSQNQDVYEAGVEAAKKFGNGGQSSRLISGNHQILQHLESKIADWLNYDSALCFNSGYQLNTSVLKSIGSTESIHIFIDKLAHNSLITGAIDSKATVHRFKHNDITHLEALINKYLNEASECWIVTESVFSMQGDETPIAQLISLAEKYNCFTYVDEAHAFGLIGEKGRGVAYPQKPTILVGTFGKAFGSNGAFLVTSKEIADWLVNFSSGFIYTTALSPFSAGASLKSLELIINAKEERRYLKHLGDLLKKELNLELDSRGSIIPLKIGQDDRVLQLAEMLKSDGIFAIAIRPPTVPQGESCIRFSLRANLEETEVKHLVKAIKFAKHKLELNQDIHV